MCTIRVLKYYTELVEYLSTRSRSIELSAAGLAPIRVVLCDSLSQTSRGSAGFGSTRQ